MTSHFHPTASDLYRCLHGRAPGGSQLRWYLLVPAGAALIGLLVVWMGFHG